MIADGPFAWSSRLRYDRIRKCVVLRSTADSVAHVLMQYASHPAWLKFIDSRPELDAKDVHSCFRLRQLEVENPGKDMVAFLDLDDTTATAPVHPFVKRMAEEIPLTYGPRPKVANLQDATLRILNTASDLFGATGNPIRNPEAVLETLARIAAECQRCAEDLGLIEGEVIDPSFVEIPEF